MKSTLYQLTIIFLILSNSFTASAIKTESDYLLPSEVLSPIEGDLEFVYSLEECSNTIWCFNQHKTGGHSAGGGICQSNDTYAWDVNLNYPEFDSDNGKPVYSVAEGIVPQTYGGCINAGGSYGQLLIEHSYEDNKWWSGYLHLIDIQVTQGDSVDQNTLLGYISNTSLDPIPSHLHFVVYGEENSTGNLTSFNANIVTRYGDFSPQTPSLISPPNNSIIITSTPAFKWSSASNADYYGLYISKPPYGPDNLVFDSEEDYGFIYDTTFTEIPSNIFINGVKYYWNVRAHFSSGWGDFSDSYNFTADFDDSVIIVPDDYSSIQTAIDSSDNGYTIIIKDGIYTENLDINKSLTIKSENGASKTTIQAANSNDHIFYIYADSITITGIKITGTNSSAIYACYSSLKMENVNIADNGGDAIRFDSGNSLTLKSCSIERNGKGIRYDGYAAKGNAIVENNLIKNNAGSGLYINLAGDRSVTIRHNVIDSNSGNGIYCYIEDAGGTAIIEDNIINYSGGVGVCFVGIKNSTLSGITIDNSTNSGLEISSGSNLTLEKPFSITNSGSYGIYSVSTEIEIDSLIITDNNVYGIYFYYGKALTVRNCIIERNRGGIIYTGDATGDAIVENNKIKNNTGSGIAVKLAVGRNASIRHNEINSCSGTGIYCSIADAGGKANIEDNVINYSGEDGIYLIGVKNSTLTRITIDNSTSQGLEINSGSNLTLEKPFSITNSGGYGIYLGNTEIEIDSLIITDNNGYGIYFNYGKALTVRDCIIERNGGGIIYSRYAIGDAIVENNKIINNSYHGIDINLAIGRNASIKNNEIDSNSRDGIRCSIADAGGEIELENNYIKNNGYYYDGSGIYLQGIKKSNIKFNLVQNNKRSIYLNNSSNNNIFLNNFVDNSNGVYIYNSTTIWQSPYEISYTYNESELNNFLGNYWSSYIGSENYNVSTEVSVDNTGNIYSDDYIIYQNYPNPFNPITSIRYFIPKFSNVKISIYDLRGTLIKTLVNQEIHPGFHKIQWNASDVGSGVYIYQIQAGNFSEVKKCVFIK